MFYKIKIATKTKSWARPYHYHWLQKHWLVPRYISNDKKNINDYVVFGMTVSLKNIYIRYDCGDRLWW